MLLDSRKEIILRLVVEDYILTVEPVASQRLVEKYNLEICPATVRHEMSVLEELGFLKQPHPSAGRIPTDKGYRYYVDNLEQPEGLALEEKKDIENLYALSSKGLEELMRETSDLLSRLTSYIAVIFSPPLKKSVLKRLDLISLSPQTVLMVLITDTGLVEKKIIHYENFIEPEVLQELERILNRKFVNLSLEEISKALGELSFVSPKEKVLAERIFEEGYLAEEEKERVFWGGTTNILGQPEFGSSQRFQSLLEALEGGYSLLTLLRDVLDHEKVVVKIGSEIKPAELEGLSFVASSYKVNGETLGALGLLGPTRMNYPRAISAVKYIAENLGVILESFHP